MFSLHAFSGSIATSSAFTNLAAVPDPTITTSGNLLYVGALQNLLGAYFFGGAILRGQITSPSLLNITPLDVAPVDVSVLPSTNPPIFLQEGAPYKLIETEALQAFATTSANEQASALIWLGDGAIAPISGEIVHARATATSGSTGYVWSNASLSFETQLPAGSYNIVGVRAEGANLIAIRLVFQGSASFRPGVIGVGSAHAIEPLNGLFRNGKFGSFGSFNQFNPPSIDIINNGTSETIVLYLDLIKTG